MVKPACRIIKVITRRPFGLASYPENAAHLSEKITFLRNGCPGSVHLHAGETGWLQKFKRKIS